MDHERLQQSLESIIPTLSAEAELSMSVDDAAHIHDVNSRVVAIEKLLQDAASSLGNIKNRIYVYRTSGNPDVILKSQNDF